MPFDYESLAPDPGAPAPVSGAAPSALERRGFDYDSIQNDLLGRLDAPRSPTILERLFHGMSGLEGFGGEIVSGFGDEDPWYQDVGDAFKQLGRGVEGMFSGDIAPDNWAFQGMRSSDDAVVDAIRTVIGDRGDAGPMSARQGAWLGSRMQAGIDTVKDWIPGGFSREEAAKENPEMASYAAQRDALYNRLLPEQEKFYADAAARGEPELNPLVRIVGGAALDPTTYIPGAVLAKGVTVPAKLAKGTLKVADNLVTGGRVTDKLARTFQHGAQEIAEAVGRRGEDVTGTAFGSAAQQLEKRSNEIIERVAKETGLPAKEIKAKYGEQLTKAIEGQRNPFDIYKDDLAAFDAKHADALAAHDKANAAFKQAKADFESKVKAGESYESELRAYEKAKADFDAARVAGAGEQGEFIAKFEKFVNGMRPRFEREIRGGLGGSRLTPEQLAKAVDDRVNHVIDGHLAARGLKRPDAAAPPPVPPIKPPEPGAAPVEPPPFGFREKVEGEILEPGADIRFDMASGKTWVKEAGSVPPPRPLGTPHAPPLKTADPVQAELVRPHEVKRYIKEIEDKIKNDTGLVNVARGATTDDVARAVAEQFGAKHGRELLDAVKDTKHATGVGISYRKGYVFHKHTDELKKWIGDKFGALSEVTADAGRLDEIARAATNLDAAGLDALARQRGIWSGEKNFTEWLASYARAIKDGGRGTGKPGLLKSVESGDVAKLQRALGGTVEELNDFFKAAGFTGKKALETDGIQLLNASGRQASRAVGTRRMVVDMMNRVGYQGARQGMKDVNVSDILKRAGIDPKASPDIHQAIGDRWIPEAFVDDLQRSAKEMIDPATPGKVLETVRRINAWAQKNVIAWFPQYYKLNMATGIQQNLIWEGMGPLSQAKRATQALKLMKQMSKGGRLTGTVKLGKRTIQGDELQALIEANDVMMTMAGTMAGARAGTAEAIGVVPRAAQKTAGSVLGAPFRAAGRMSQRMLKMGAGADNMNRLGLFLELLDRGQDGIQAAKRVNELHFPLDVLTAAERGTAGSWGLRDVAMFYSWPRHSLPFTVRMAMQHPKAHYMVAKGLQGLGRVDYGGEGFDVKGPGEYEPDQPFWQREKLKIGIGDGENEAGMRGFRTLPEEALEMGEMLRDPERFIGRANPAMKFAYEKMTGRDSFYQQPINELYRMEGVPGGLEKYLPFLDHQPPGKGSKSKRGTVDPEAYHAYRSIPPVGRALSTAQSFNKSPEAAAVAQFAPLPFAMTPYKYNEDLWGRLRVREMQRIFDNDIQPEAMRHGWMTRSGFFTKTGKKEAPALYRAWLKMKAKAKSGSFSRAG